MSRQADFAGSEPWRLLSLTEHLKAQQTRAVLVTPDRAALERACLSVQFFAPELEVLRFPAWDCRPYDSLSPSAETMALRLSCLHRLSELQNRQNAQDIGTPLLVITSVAAVLQRVAPRTWFAGRSQILKQGTISGLDSVREFLHRNGYRRVENVALAGEYAVRGGLLDVLTPAAFAPAAFEASSEEAKSEGGHALRLDFFGEELERIRVFDPVSQRSLAEVNSAVLLPASEVLADAKAIKRFRLGWRKHFGAQATRDGLYRQMSALADSSAESQNHSGQTHDSLGEASIVATGADGVGLFHHLPLLHESMETLADFLPRTNFYLEPQVPDYARLREDEVQRGYTTRTELEARENKARRKSALQYEVLEAETQRALPTEALYLKQQELEATIKKTGGQVILGTDEVKGDGVVLARDFASARGTGKLLEELKQEIQVQRRAKRRVLFACFSENSLEHLRGLLSENELTEVQKVTSLAELESLPIEIAGLALLPLGHGFYREGLCIFGEYDLLGKRVQTRGKTRHAEDFVEALAGLHELEPQDLVVHHAHGIGQFLGLETLVADKKPHDCLRVAYRGGDSILVPVEHMDLLSRYGGKTQDVELDLLGRSGWQLRQARVRGRLRDMAERLIALAVERAELRVEPTLADLALYERFKSGFGWVETPDQQEAIAAVEESLSLAHPMERMICGDAGFGKTEIALRASCLVAASGRQVAIVAPTTLLAHQHYRNFKERFADLPFRVAQFSRLVPEAQQKESRALLAAGKVDIAVGTHALLAERISFADLGLLVIDEEQRFGVKQKERLKGLRLPPNEGKSERKGEGKSERQGEKKSEKKSVSESENSKEKNSLVNAPHVLTLSATPIPRTLQQALHGITDMSLISTPPPMRTAVRTFIGTWDSAAVREALLREKRRGGQSFVVVPQVRDLESLRDDLERLVPELSVCQLHGGVSAAELEETMVAFLRGDYDVLLSTDIIESGLDIPRANTLLVWRPDRFGLAQLYQLRGRVGRGNETGWAYFYTRPHESLTQAARQRFAALQRMDGLGVGFSLAAADLEIRGGGNLLGEEQSGQIREVGLELYQRMLTDAMKAARENRDRKNLNKTNRGGKNRGETNRDRQNRNETSRDTKHQGGNKLPLDLSSQDESQKTITELKLDLALRIPEDYIEGLGLRLDLYRRLSRLESPEAFRAFREEMEDRFGVMPEAMDNLCRAMALKRRAEALRIIRVEAQARMIRLHFGEAGFSNPLGLVRWLEGARGAVSLGADSVLVWRTSSSNGAELLEKIGKFLAKLEKIAAVE